MDRFKYSGRAKCIMFKIILKNERLPARKKLDDDLDWLCRSMGISSGRDVDKNAICMFKIVVRGASDGKRITSDFLSDKMNLTRGAINHHLRWFIDSGIFVRDKCEIKLREDSIRQTIREIKRDSERIFEDLLDIASNVDNEIGIYRK